MPETYTYEKRHWYPHMMPADVAIWERFIEKYPLHYDLVQYDVKVGSLPDFDTVVSPETGGDASALYKKKIDVVGFMGDDIDIIELKPRAGAPAVGQVKLYRKLYIKEFGVPYEPRCVLITDTEIGDVREFAEDEGVHLFVV